MKKLGCLMLLLVVSLCNGQHISGWVFDAIGQPLDSVRITNLVQNNYVYSTVSGNFRIRAQPSDSIQLVSSKQEKLVIVRPEDLDNELYIYLEGTVNQLEEVVLTDFDEEAYTEQFNHQLKEDFKNNPYKYQKPSYQPDVVKIIGLIARQFRKKKKKEEVLPSYINFEELENLFATDDFFTHSLLTQTLKIPKENIGLFFAYCSAQQLDGRYLKKENRLDLLDELVWLSRRFLNNIEP